MRKFAIITDATIDISPEYAAGHSITVLPMGFTLWDKTYLHYNDYRELPSEEFYNALKSGATVKTASINLADFADCFEGIVKYGMDVLYIGFSSGISGTYNVSRMAAAEVSEKYPDAKIICVDSLTTSIGLNLMIYKADEMRSAGKSIEETAKWLSDNALSIHHWFMVDDLQHLRRGGRISPVAASLGTALGIKPVLTITTQGALEVCAKVRGAKKGIEYIVEQFEKTCTDMSERMCIAHSSNPLGAMTLVEELKKYGANDVEVTKLSPIVGAHTGPGLIGFVYFGKPRG